MSYELRIDRIAQAYLSRLDRTTQARIVRRLAEIAEDPFGEQTKQLKGRDRQRATRIGGWRIIFSADREANVVAVTDIAPRGQVYRPR